MVRCKPAEVLELMSRAVKQGDFQEVVIYASLLPPAPPLPLARSRRSSQVLISSSSTHRHAESERPLRFRWPFRCPMSSWRGCCIRVPAALCIKCDVLFSAPHTLSVKAYTTDNRITL